MEPIKEYTPIRELYKAIRSDLQKDLGIANVMAVPTIEKIVLNVGVGKIQDDNAMITEIRNTLVNISGQAPVSTKSKLAISNFNLRKGVNVGLMVTLRGERMWFFLDKLINIALPRTKDFRGVSKRSFDGKGNYSMGLKDQTIFPEVDTAKSNRLHGLEISIITTAVNDAGGLALLQKLNMPFRQN